ncbi:MAG: hypothetical protein ACLU5K_03750 [Christensenellales bacterium]
MQNVMKLKVPLIADVSRATAGLIPSKEKRMRIGLTGGMSGKTMVSSRLAELARRCWTPTHSQELP